ncbi:MAG TPA: endo-1,4-beta-xylanase [Verrucomicrobiae bacterium]|nr:endo-1,4-beta-xylanase [Verrucomicrobiae bacterium]
MNKHIASTMIALAVSAASLYAQNNNDAKPAAPTPTIGLKDAFAGKFLIGTAGDVPGGYSEAELANIKANYNVITPENCMKPQIHPAEDRYDWARADALVQWCQDNDIKVWGHNLCWHAQTPGWFFQGPNGEPVTRELAMERLSNHIHTVVEHFKGKVIGWDVVNEAIDDRDNNGQPDNLRNDSWYHVIGSNYLTMAFKWAHEADPNAQLYYNDYNIEQGAVTETGKHAASMSLLRRMIKDGAPINGVGIQGHWHLDTDLADVEKAIEDYHSLGLKVAISELDVTASGGNSGSFNVGGGGGFGGFGRGGGALTADQNTQLNTAFTAAQAGLTSLQDKLTAAQKDVVTAVLARSDDATVQSKLAAVAKIQAEIAMLRYTKGVEKIAATVTEDQKTNINANVGQTYYALFGGTPPAFGGRGGRGGRGGFGGFGGFGGGGAPITAEELQKQAQVYAKLFEIFDRHADTISRVTFWGISDTRSWRRGQAALVFDGDLQPKPALKAILKVAEGSN